MRKCILHVGSPKTGTTSIQYVLGENRRIFAKHGILVPASGQSKAGSHARLAQALAGVDVKPEYAQSHEDFVRDVERSDLRTVLLSAEFMSVIFANPLLAERLVERLRALNFEITLLLYVRNQPQFVNSSYSQGVKTFRHCTPFNRYVEQRLANVDRLHFGRWPEIAERHGVKLIVRPFTAGVRESLIKDFLATVGISTHEAFDQAVALNESTGPFAVALARRLMRKISAGKQMTLMQANRCTKQLREAVEALRLKEPSYCGLSTDMARRIQDACEADNDKLAMLAWGRTWAEVFASDVGREFQPNDYGVVGVAQERKPALDALYDTLLPRFRRIMDNADLASQADWNKMNKGIAKKKSPRIGHQL